MTEPPGYFESGVFSRVCRLKNAIYGLKHYSRAWFDNFSIVVAHYGLKQSVSDHSIFVRSLLLYYYTSLC